MIDCLGFYMTRGGQMVEITRILESQPIAEGYLLKGEGGFRDSFHIWNIDGSFNRLKETDRDIVRLKYRLTAYEYSDD